jgi:hypothetical protein
MTTAQMPARLGQHAIFRDHDGLPKAALITGTADTIDSERASRSGQVPPLHSPDEVHLQVFSPTGSMEVRHNIRRGTKPGQWEPDGTG